jgi:hypothetical protein
MGKDFDVALKHLEQVDHIAGVFWRVKALGNVNRMPQEDLEYLSCIRGM